MKHLSSISMLLSISTGVFALPANEDFSVIPDFPQPALGAFSVVGTTTIDGQFVFWNGNEVFLQDQQGGGVFTSIASGYLGDPAFLTLNPSGDMALLGQGFGDGTNANLYVIDLNSPADFIPGEEILVPNHFSGVFLSENLVALDRGDFGLPAEIIVLDLSSIARSREVVVTVLQIPEPPEGRMAVVTKPPGSFSASLAVNDGLLYVADAGNGQYKTFLVADLIAAFNTSMSIPWGSGTDIGTPFQYPLGGVAGFTATGNLVIAGFGSIVEVLPLIGTVVNTIDPAGTAPFYGIIYNGVTEDLIAIEFPAISGDPLIFYASIGGIPDAPTFVGTPSSGSGGCLIATAAYGTPLAREIDVLRMKRDRRLLTNALGTAFVDTYYRMSPPVADRIASSAALKSLTRLLLRPVLWGTHSGLTVPWAVFAISSIIFLHRVRSKRIQNGAGAGILKQKRH